MEGKKYNNRLVKEPEKGIYVEINGKTRESYWKDSSLSSKYENCDKFLKEVERRFGHVKTDINWSNQLSTDAEKSKRDFKSWLSREIGHPELKECFDNSKRQTIEEIKKFLLGENVS